MSTEKTDGLVIRMTDFSETSRIVTLFTREFGKILALAKGAKRLKGPFEAALDLLAECEIVFIRKSTSGLDILTEARLKSRFQPRNRSLLSLYGGYYVAELLCGLTEEYDPHPTLYDEAIHTLRDLAEEDNAAIAILRFEFVTLREIGQLPTLDACLACGQTVGDRESVAFWVTQSGLLCRRCQKQDYQQFNIQAGTVAIMRRLASESRSASRNLVASKQQTKEMRRFATAAISSILGRRPKMLRYLQT